MLSRLQFDHVFTSADHRTNKSGGMFEIVLRTLCLAGPEVLHVGDNPEADGEFPRRLGIRRGSSSAGPSRSRALTPRRRASGRRDRRICAQTLASGLTAARTKVLSRPELIGIPTALQRCSARC